MTDDTTDPRHAHREEGFPAQHQNQPGLTEQTRPEPDHGERTYVGHGRLEGRRALITGGDSGIGRAVAIEFLGPLVLAAVLTRKLSDFTWVGVALLGMVVLGIDGLIGAEPLDPLGVVFILIAAGFWAMYIRMSARVGALIPGSSGLAMGLVVAAVLLIPVGIPAASTVAMDPQLLLLAAITAVLSSVIPYSFELAALRRLQQRVFGVLLSLEPAFATLAGWLILGQDATPLRLLAIALVIAASVGTTLGVRRDRRDGGPSGPFTAPIPLPD